MQITIYYRDTDLYLMELVDQVANRERKSRSAVILDILEDYFMGDKRLGEILVNMGKLTQSQVDRLLQQQADEGGNRRLGELLLGAELISEKDLQRALAAQKRDRPDRD